jgi:hypothetical protein
VRTFTDLQAKAIVGTICAVVFIPLGIFALADNRATFHRYEGPAACPLVEPSTANAFAQSVGLPAKVLPVEKPVDQDVLSSRRSKSGVVKETTKNRTIGTRCELLFSAPEAISGSGIDLAGIVKLTVSIIDDRVSPEWWNANFFYGEPIPALEGFGDDVRSAMSVSSNPESKIRQCVVGQSVEKWRVLVEADFIHQDCVPVVVAARQIVNAFSVASRIPTTTLVR